MRKETLIRATTGLVRRTRRPGSRVSVRQVRHLSDVLRQRSPQLSAKHDSSDHNLRVRSCFWQQIYVRSADLFVDATRR